VKTEELIVQLAGAARPINRLRSPVVRFGQWLAWTVLVAGGGVLLIGPRPDLASAIDVPVYAVSLILLTVTAVGAAAAALVLAVPGAERSWLQRWLPVAGSVVWAGVWTISMAVSAPSEEPNSRLFHLACALEIVLLAAVSGAVLFGMVARGAPLRLTWAAAVPSVAALASSAVATQVICPIGDPAHQVISHVLVAGLACLLGILAGRRMLRA
jgi:hypothetical protein